MHRAQSNDARDDPVLAQFGQATQRMSDLLPRLNTPALHTRAGLPQIGALDRYDAVLLLLPAAVAPDARLPCAPRWKALHLRGPTTHASVRTVTLDNARLTLGAVAWCNADADAFERLRVAGLLAQRALADRPKPRRIAVIAQTSARHRAAWQEALCAAIGAQCFALPATRLKSEDQRAPVAVDIYGDAGLDLKRVTSTIGATNLVRHLTALPPNQLDASGYRRVLTQLARRHRLRLRWHDESKLQRLGAGAFLAVSRGNARRDAGIAHLSYVPARRVRRSAGVRGGVDVALVGKGILFDTGGTNLKAHRSMLDMHTDMSGSAVALATLVALAELKAPVAVDAWLAISENSIGPRAYRPQEVVRAVNGTTIQIIHSDAEGRLVLADTLALASQTRPRLIVDFATLTGACVYALTERMSGLFTNHQALAQAALAAGRDSGERLWHFPLPADFDTDLESATADVAQCAVDGKGDHILAARFLQRFVPDSIPWAHIDLSSAMRRGGLAHVTTDITGFGARFALSLLLDHRISA
jgi:leucyl aminopeptidase